MAGPDPAVHAPAFVDPRVKPGGDGCGRFVIRRAHRRDAEALAALIRCAYRDVAERFDLTADNAPSHPSNCRADWITRDLARGRRYYLLRRGGTLCGCVALRWTAGQVAYVERLAVPTACRRQGLGRALLDCALREAACAGKRQLRLGLIAEHVELVNWYRRRGFVWLRRESHAHLPFTVAVYRAPIRT